ncbi:YceI family protein [Reichenbachiella versicolor]|uniref:YceI family protein n=1 Tax=Reichenbachiella versicolor TaxID=1821036 RepID=UPI000D6EA0D1|nr:YceI family protein [Reichenbachiella versicolor]
MLNTILALMTVFMTTATPAQNVEVDASASKIIWNATKVTGAHSGTIDIKEGELEYKGNQLIGGEFTIDMTTINTTDLEGEWKDKLDGHLKSDDFFGVDKYATAKFKITKVKSTGSDKYTVTGDVTIKGITESVTFPASVKDGKAKAKITLDRTKFNVRYGSNSFFDNLGDKAIHDEFTLDVSLVTK